MSGRETILEMAQHLARNCHSLQLKAKVTFRQSVLMRLAGNIKGSQQIIEDCLSGLRDESVDLHVAALFISQASNHVYQFCFSIAHEQIKNWMPFRDIPGKQEQLLWDQISCIGRILRGQGQFMEAKRCFETCLGSPGLPDAKAFLMKSNLADLYCELDYSEGPGNSYLPRAAEMVGAAVEQLRRSSRQHLKGYRRLLLSFVEVRMRQGQYREAGDNVTELLAIYGNLGEIDIVDRLGHVRTLIAFARLSLFAQDALRRWSDVLAWNKFYNPLEEEVFTCCVAYHAISNALNALGNTIESSENFCKATEISRRRSFQFLIPGVGTYIYDQVLQNTVQREQTVSANDQSASSLDRTPGAKL
ncbi:hypothetical protein N7466_011081 [Penicillium verhagenii]|uniref:uncharacterized protein n=1 Tax=Penicillium verhagenii TaxID=1562060 RepID=UPI002545B9E6|nr:uncharacterized protein N7466_011081 [Penicillium verhagenii]KAJ5917527.1 hypothetical protein N7466_011081 [Penicillium verhagenii]